MHGIFLVEDRNHDQMGIAKFVEFAQIRATAKRPDQLKTAEQLGYLMSADAFDEKEARDDIDVVFDRLIRPHFVRFARALTTGFMALFSVLVISGSLAKALLVSVLFVLISMFHSWHRFLGPVTFLVFMIAVGIWIGVDAMVLVKKTKMLLATD